MFALPAYIYHPASDACWPAFRRGPCQEGEYLVLPLNSVLPACEKNPCFNDTYVYWNGKCERLDTTPPCNHILPMASVLGVNATTLVVSCVRLNLESRFCKWPRCGDEPHLPAGMQKKSYRKM